MRQAEVLARRYDAVVANPPYMGSKYMTQRMKDYLKESFKGSHSDMFAACFEAFPRLDTGGRLLDL